MYWLGMASQTVDICDISSCDSIVTRESNLIKRRAVYYQNVNLFSPYNVPFSGFKSAINIRQMYFMNPLKPTSRCERIS